MDDTPDKVKIASLVSEHHRAVYQYAYRLTGSVQDAEDLTQQVFLAAQMNVGNLRSLESAKSWLFTILRNRFLKEKQRRRPVLAADIELNVEAIAVPPLQEEIDRERLQEVLKRLPEASRVVLGMFYFEDCSYQEIAKQLGVPMGTVMSRLARAKAYLRSALFEAEHGNASRSKAALASTSQ
jgi:RNA polymerase sigma-70 factor, ECF subfamily